MARQTGKQVQRFASQGKVSQPDKRFSRGQAPVHPILALQQTIGNQAVLRLLQSPQFQAKLKVSQPDDPYEQEADRVADTVMRMPEPATAGREKTSVQAQPLANQISPLVQRIAEPELEDEPEGETAAPSLLQRVPLAARDDDDEEVQTKSLSSVGSTVQLLCTECEEETVQKKEQAGQTPAHSSPAEAQISNVQNSGGEPLSESVRAFFEPRFGQDFSQVRVHQGSQAAASARAVNARAYTTGRNIAFGAGEYAPETNEGRRLLAHELTHVVQQSSDRASHGQRMRQPKSDAVNQHPDATSKSVFSGGSITTKPAIQIVNSDRIQRQEVVDLEVPSPAELEALRQRGIQLPQVSSASADPRRHSDYVDRKVTAVGFGIYLGGYAVYCDDLPLPVFVPSTHIDFSQTNVTVSDVSIYPDRAAALSAIPADPPPAGQAMPMTFYRGAGGGLVAPAFFSPATTPRFIEAALRARRELAEQVQRDLLVLAVTLVAGRALQVLLNRIARIGSRDVEPPRASVPPGTGEAFGRQMAQEMQAASYRGNPFREIMRRLNARPQLLPPQEAAEAIRVGTREFTSGTMGTMAPVQQGRVLVVPSRAPIPNAPVMGIRSDGTVMMGRAPRLEIVRDAQGRPVHPPQSQIIGNITWE